MKPLRLTNNCTGCGACVSVCKPGCIRLEPDEEGFFKAFNYENGCDGCGHCKIVCPVLHDGDREAQKIIAYQNPDEYILQASASGGAFSVLAADVLAAGGVVYGVAVAAGGGAGYLRVDRAEDLHRLRNSKYVDVNIGTVGAAVKADAASGRRVLFSGLPCTVAGMRRLVRNRPNVLWVDLLCFGKPSSTAWSEWISGFGDITDLSFKDKRNGVSHWGVSFREAKTGRERFVPKSDCPPLKAWLSQENLSRRCLTCPHHGFRRPGDISLGDFWGIETRRPDITKETIEKGVSMVLFNTEKSLELLPLFADGLLHDAEGDRDFARFNKGLSPFTPKKPKMKRSVFGKLRHKLLGR